MNTKQETKCKLDVTSNWHMLFLNCLFYVTNKNEKNGFRKKKIGVTDRIRTCEDKVQCLSI